MDYKNNRIKLEMSIQDVIIVMVDGNPGALRVCMELLTSNELGIIDLCNLDDMKIYGSEIWIAYKDVCKENIEVLRSKIRDRSIKRELAEYGN